MLVRDEHPSTARVERRNVLDRHVLLERRMIRTVEEIDEHPLLTARAGCPETSDEVGVRVSRTVHASAATIWAAGIDLDHVLLVGTLRRLRGHVLFVSRRFRRQEVVRRDPVRRRAHDVERSLWKRARSCRRSGRMPAATLFFVRDVSEEIDALFRDARQDDGEIRRIEDVVRPIPERTGPHRMTR